MGVKNGGPNRDGYSLLGRMKDLDQLKGIIKTIN